MRIGELAELAGVTTRTVRHYHRIGLLPEPGRASNGYRTYELRHAVQLVRIRRLVELGLSLGEAADALAEDDDRELREILVELAADLAGQEQRIRAQREHLDRLLTSDDDLTMSAELNDALRELTRAVGPGHPAIERERLVLQLVEPLAGTDASQFWSTYRNLLGDDHLVAGALDLERRFTQLVDADPDDPAVDELAQQARGLGEFVFAHLPEDMAADDGDPEAAERLRQALIAGLAPAQARCLTLMFAYWRDAAR